MRIFVVVFYALCLSILLKSSWTIPLPLMNSLHCYEKKTFNGILIWTFSSTKIVHQNKKQYKKCDSIPNIWQSNHDLKHSFEFDSITKLKVWWFNYYCCQRFVVLYEMIQRFICLHWLFSTSHSSMSIYCSLSFVVGCGMFSTAIELNIYSKMVVHVSVTTYSVHWILTVSFSSLLFLFTSQFYLDLFNKIRLLWLHNTHSFYMLFQHFPSTFNTNYELSR